MLGHSMDFLESIVILIADLSDLRINYRTEECSKLTKE